MSSFRLPIPAFVFFSLFTSVGMPTIAAENEPPPRDDADAASWVTSMAAVGDGRWLAGTADGLLLRPADVVTFDAADPSHPSSRYKHEASVWAVAISADKKLAATADYRGNLAIMDMEAGEAKIFNDAGGRWSRCMAFSADAKTLLIGNEAGEIIVWSIADAKIAETKPLAPAAIHAITPAQIGETDGWIVSASDGSVQFCDHSMASLATVSIGDHAALCVLVDGQSAYVGGADRKIHHIEMSVDDGKPTLQPPTLVCDAGDWVTSMVKLGDRVYAGDLSGEITVLRLGGVDKLSAPSGIWCLAVAGEHLLAATRRNGVVVVQP